MAAKTPASFPTAGGVDIHRGLYISPAAGNAVGEVMLTVGSREDNRLKYFQEIHYFADLDDGDTWASGIRGIRAVFWMGDDTDTDKAACAWDGVTGLVTFDVENADTNGWVLLFIDPVIGVGRGGLRQL